MKALAAMYRCLWCVATICSSAGSSLGAAPRAGGTAGAGDSASAVHTLKLGWDVGYLSDSSAYHKAFRRLGLNCTFDFLDLSIIMSGLMVKSGHDCFFDRFGEPRAAYHHYALMARSVFNGRILISY